MIVYRLANGAFKNDLSGHGAEISGGRWNSKGRPMVYTSGSRALCLLEIAVHIPLHLIPDNYWLISIEVPDLIVVKEMDAKILPADWKSIPAGYSTQLVGDQFLNDGKYAVIKVPSVIVPGEFNYLLNPAHKLAKKVKVVAVDLFPFDERLFRK